MLSVLVTLSFLIVDVYTEQQCTSPSELRDAIMDFLSDCNLVWDEYMARDAQEMLSTGLKPPYHGVFSSRGFRGNQPTTVEKIRQTLGKGYHQITGHLSTATYFGCGCVHQPSTNYDFMRILCVDLTHPNG